MMRWIVGSSLRFRLLVVAVAAAMIVVGIVELREMPVDVLPEFAPPTVEVQTEALGLSAAEVEQLITVPLEQDLLNGVAFLDDIRSESVPGLSSIELIFEPGTDLLPRTAGRAGAPHAGRMRSRTCRRPPQMLQPLSSTSRVMMIGLSSKTVSPIEMSVLARWTIGPALMGVPGVANVSIWGQRERQLQVQVDPERLRERGVSLAQVIETTGNALWVSPLTFLEASTPGTGGFIDTPNQRLGVQHLSPISTASRPGQGAGRRHADGKLRLGDVADGRRGSSAAHRRRRVTDEARVSAGRGEVPGGEHARGDPRRRGRARGLRPGLSGIDVRHATSTGRRRYIENVDRQPDALALIIGVALAGPASSAPSSSRWRTRADRARRDPAVARRRGARARRFAATRSTRWSWPASRWPSRSSSTTRSSTSRTSSGGCVERRGSSRLAGRRRTVSRGLARDAGPIAYATLIIALVRGARSSSWRASPARSSRPIACRYALALVASMLVALDRHAGALHPASPRDAPVERGESPSCDGSSAATTACSRARSRTPRRSSAPVRSWSSRRSLAVPFLEQSLLPTFKDGGRADPTGTAAPGTSLPEMDRITAGRASELRSLPGVETSAPTSAAPCTATRSSASTPASSGSASIPPPTTTRPSPRSRRSSAGYPGLSTRASRRYSERARAANVCHGLSDDRHRSRLRRGSGRPCSAKAEEVTRAVSGVDGVVDRACELPVERADARDRGRPRQGPAARDQAGRRPPGGGHAALRHRRRQPLRGAEGVRGRRVGSARDAQQPDDIRELLIDTPSGGHVRLGEVADVRIASNPAVIQRRGRLPLPRRAARRRAGDRRAVARRRRGSTPRDRTSRSSTTRGPGVFGPSAGAAGCSRSGIAAAIGIFLLLQAAFGSWRLAALAFLDPARRAWREACSRRWSTGGTLSLGSFVGFARRVRTRGRDRRPADRALPTPRATTKGEPFGAAARPARRARTVRPDRPTALATASCSCRWCSPAPRRGYEIVQPMAVVVLGGLVTSTLLSLFVVPRSTCAFASRASRAPTQIAPARAGIIARPRASSRRTCKTAVSVSAEIDAGEAAALRWIVSCVDRRRRGLVLARAAAEARGDGGGGGASLPRSSNRGNRRSRGSS